MQQSETPRVILGGTFDPIHFGHLRLAENLHNLLPTAKIHLMPSASPPHRTKPGATAQQRLAMLELAVENIDHLHVDARELSREGDSYTLLSIDEMLQENPQQSIILVMGDDAYANLGSWYQWSSILDKVNIVVVARPGEFAKQPSADVLAKQTRCNSIEQLLSHRSGAVYRHFCPLLEISASYIRQLLAKKQSCRFLLPGSVLKYIKQNRLYC